MTENQRPKRKGVMLAVPADQKKIAKLGPTFYIQPKLDGERGVTTSFMEKPIILSSYENPFDFLDKITGEIEKIWQEVGSLLPFDGEIYKHGWPRERIDSALRRKKNYNPEVEELEYHIFDIKLPIPQNKRIQILSYVEAKLPATSHLKIVPTCIGTAENWMTYADAFLKLGFEGAMLRKITYPQYEARRLTNQLLKYKPTEIDEYQIISVNEAISKEGKPKGMIGSFEVQGNDNQSFSVGAGKLPHTLRVAYWQRQEIIIGKTLVTKQGKIRTTEGFPTCAVALEIKE